jgi:hypothetical protein
MLMPIIDLNNWYFKLGGGHSVLVAHGLASPPSILKFPTAIELLKYLANDGIWQADIQNSINRRLKADPEAKSWHRQRDFLKNLLHFPRYKRRDYDTYHDAARKLACGTSTAQQTSMVNGLNSEIAASKVIVPQGQILFHGRADHALTATACYSTFISTSLDPVVAICSAQRRAGVGAKRTFPTVYMLTTQDPLPAIWGNGGKPYEWEVLLQTNLSCGLSTIHHGSRFNVIEATIGI